MTTSTPQRVRVHAPAKINLTLRVLGSRADGYHELRTTFQSIALRDTLIFERAPEGFAIVADDPACPTDRSNLVWKAASQLWEAVGRRGEPPGVRVRIRKRIPSEAGLGGGSSDAASTLRALQVLWHTRVSAETLEAVARGLGADVAFLLHGGTVLGVDRGDLLFPLVEAPRAWVVLARPDFGVSTRDAYGWWDEEHRRPQQTRTQKAVRADSQPFRFAAVPASEWVNDLQAPVAARHPRIADLVRKLQRAGAQFAAMSGSGSAVFGLFGSRSEAVAGAARLGRGVDTWITRTTTASEHIRLSAPTVV